MDFTGEPTAIIFHSLKLENFKCFILSLRLGGHSFSKLISLYFSTLQKKILKIQNRLNVHSQIDEKQDNKIPQTKHLRIVCLGWSVRTFEFFGSLVES